MAVVVPAPPALSGELSVFHTTDPLLSNAPVLVFHGPASTIGATSSRIQVHVFTPAGHGSYPRLAVSPNSPFYSAVSNLPREEQGDEVVRGLAFGLKKYFAELPEDLKKAWSTEAKAKAPGALFGDPHVAILASRMKNVSNVEEVIEDVNRAFGEQRLSWLDVDVVLPSGSIRGTSAQASSEDANEPHQLVQRYGRYAELVDSLGDVAFVPTSKVKRAPSKASSIGRSPSFLKAQKDTVRKELNELLDTEENYVTRLNELLAVVDTLAADLNTANQEQLNKIFPATIAGIAKLNTAFLKSLRAEIERTQDAAVHEIETTDDEVGAPSQTRSDTQSVESIAKCLCDWLPKFSRDYQEYTKSHTQSAQLLRDTLRQLDSTLATRLQEIGEQKLSSLLIEPVQRLPRYNLYIDSIAKQLPSRHPAIKPLLSARDIVTEICDHEDTAAATASTIDKLRSRVSDWPARMQIAGRLVTAADFTELVPPYASQTCDAGQGILLLFTDGLVVLQKQGANAPSARSLMTEIESGQAATRMPSTRPTTPDDLRFSRRMPLNSFDYSEFSSGQCLQVTARSTADETAHFPHSSKMESCQVLRLDGFYERKAERLVEEITKARVEGRFSEAERESSRWEARASDPAADTVSVFSAIFEDSNPDFVKARSTNAAIRIIVDIDRHTNRPRAGHNGIRTIISLSPSKDGLWRFSVDSLDINIGRETLTLSDLTKVLRRRLTAVAVARYNIEQPHLTGCLLARNLDVLQCVKLSFKAEEDDSSTHSSRSERVSRPISPRKLLTGFLAGGGANVQPTTSLTKGLPALPPPKVTKAPPVSLETPKSPSREGRPSSKDQLTPKSMVSLRSTEQLSLSSPLKRLEETLSAYLLALQHRKGNIVGRNIKMRASADEAAVNELYNSLLEDPSMMVYAGQSSVDVLFAAFEKFLNNAWKEQVGTVLPYPTLQDIQSKAETLFPTDFDDYFKSTLNALPPQNQRAFKNIMKLLGELLDGTGNDSDRGILTCAFAEVLVTEGNPHDYIALIDRFVDDPDTYFGEPLEDVQKGDGTSTENKRPRSVNSASINSNTSSLRRKFGFGLLTRENSKNEPDSKMASVWRTLSKSTRAEASPASSISRGTLFRSQSTDTDVRGPPSRPVSHDGPSVHKSTLSEDLPSLATSSTHNLGLSTIGEHPSFIPKQPPRKKRRSSLSDLQQLEKSQPNSPAWSPPASRLPPIAQQRFNVDKSLPSSPMASTPSSKGGSGRYGSPTREPARSRLPSSFRKENSPGAAKTLEAASSRPQSRDSNSAQLRPKSSDGKAEEVVITSRPTSNIPMLTPKNGSPQKAISVAPSTPVRIGLAERPGAGNIVKKPSPSLEKTANPAASTVSETGSPKKLRMQSPQKLRERLHNEQNAIAAANASLQDELSKIGEELTLTPSRMGSTAMRSSRNTSSQPSTMDLAQRVLKMESLLANQVDDLNLRIKTIQSDMSSSLTVSEAKCKKLDELYREANGENEALYTKFNDELGRILKAVRGGEGVEEMKKRLKEEQEESGRLKREVARLKRENLGLRSQIRE